jgi:uncharacterized protein YjbI with pentapeptide repeats
VWQRKPEREQKEETKQSRWGFRGMTVRNWLELLIVPLMLVAIGLVFSLQQDARQQRVEEQRADAERELAVQRAQDEALQAYLNQMSDLLLERNLRESEADSEVRTLARARTIAVLGRLDPSRKTAVMQFLVEAELMQKVDGREPIIRLAGADLRGAGVGISGGPVRGGRLVRTNLSGANLNLANLDNAKLFQTNLSGANRNTARLSGADLRWANLEGAGLPGANLRGVRGVTNEQLEQQSGYLKGATMPNGQKYEVWLKSKNREEGGKNDGSS